MLRRTAALATASAVALGGIALLVPTSASAVDSSVAAVDQDKGVRPAQRRELRQTGHTTITRETKKHGTVTVQVQRGEVTAVSPTSITLRSKDGYTHSYLVTDKTKVKSQRATVELSGLKVGARAQVVAVQDEARRIRFLKLVAGPRA